MRASACRTGFSLSSAGFQPADARFSRDSLDLSSRAKSRDLAGGGDGSDMPCSCNYEELRDFEDLECLA